MTKFKTAIAIAVGTLFAGAAFAQSNYSIEQRDRAEQSRIDRGIDSGQLTSREASRLEGERAQVERIERRARADGVVTQFERDRISRAQDRLGRDISRESHNRQTADSNWRTSDRAQGWDRRDGAGQRNFDGGARSEQFNRRDAFRGERNDSHLNGAAMRSGSDARFGRSDLSPGRQSHFQQTAGQGSQVQQGQTQRSWNRPATTTSPATSTASTTSTTTAASTSSQPAQTQHSWTRTSRTSSATTTASTAVPQAQTQRSSTRSAQTTRVSTAASPVVVARQGGYSGRHTR